LGEWGAERRGERKRSGESVIQDGLEEG